MSFLIFENYFSEIFGCPLCRLCFSHERYLSNHLKYLHSTKLAWLLNPASSRTQYQLKLQCTICKKIFYSEELLNQHYHFIHQEDTVTSQNSCNTNSGRQMLPTQINGVNKYTNSKVIFKNKCIMDDFIDCKKQSDDANSFTEHQVLDQCKTKRTDFFLKCGERYTLNNRRLPTGDELQSFDVFGKHLTTSDLFQNYDRKDACDKPYKCEYM